MGSALSSDIVCFSRVNLREVCSSTFILVTLTIALKSICYRWATSRLRRRSSRGRPGRPDPLRRPRRRSEKTCCALRIKPDHPIVAGQAGPKRSFVRSSKVRAKSSRLLGQPASKDLCRRAADQLQSSKTVCKLPCEARQTSNYTELCYPLS